MLLSAVSVLVVRQSTSEIPEGLMNNPVYECIALFHFVNLYYHLFAASVRSLLCAINICSNKVDTDFI